MGAWPDGRYAIWCPVCQRLSIFPEMPGDEAVRCATPPREGAGTRERAGSCDAPLGLEPHHVELWGELQHLDAVLAAWAGDPAPLYAILPERPRFLTDLDPPDAQGDDPPGHRAFLEAVASGEYGRAAALADDAEQGWPQTWIGRAIVHERRGEHDAALAAWEQAVRRTENAQSRLGRGALLAKMGRLEEAMPDLERAGEAFEARWNRGALLLHLYVQRAGGLPDEVSIQRAKHEAGFASPYWSDPTIGRLLWALLLERALADTDPTRAEFHRQQLRAAEDVFEHRTFWDLATVAAGWAKLGQTDEVARVAAPLAVSLAHTLVRSWPFAAGRGAEIAHRLSRTEGAALAGDPVHAREWLQPLREREDLRRFRLPCLACESGTVGIESVEEVDPAQ